MSAVSLADLAWINPRISAVANDETVDFVGMAELDATSATARARESVPFGSVSKGYTVFRDEDLLLAKITPCWENGKIGQAKLAHSVGVGSTEFHVVRPRDGVDARYLMHFLRTDRVRATGELRMTGSGGQRRVPVKYLQDLEVSVPSLDEQRRIAAVLDHADALRAQRRQVLAHLDDLAQSIFGDMFDELDAETVPLSGVADVTSGITKGRKTSEATRPVPYLAVSNVQAGALNLKVVKTLDVTEREVERYALTDGDLVLTEGGDPDKLGRGTVWRSELPLCLHQNHIFRVRPNGTVLSDFLAAYLGSPRARSYFRRSAKQTTGIASINMRQLKATPVSVPPLSFQREFVLRLSAVREVTAKVEQTLDADDQLFASLQVRAFRGEL